MKKPRKIDFTPLVAGKESKRKRKDLNRTQVRELILESSPQQPIVLAKSATELIVERLREIQSDLEVVRLTFGRFRLGQNFTLKDTAMLMQMIQEVQSKVEELMLRLEATKKPYGGEEER